MKRMFLVFTPYQLMAVINIIKNNSFNDAQVVMLNENMEKYYKNCTEKLDCDFFLIPQLYDNTFSGDSFSTKLILLFRLIKKRVIVFKEKLFYEKVDELYVPSDDLSCRAIYYKLKKVNNDIKLVLFDDGVGTYVGKLYEEKNFFSKLTFSLIVTRTFYEDIATAYVYHPELFEKRKNINVKVIKMQKETGEVLNCASEETLRLYANKKVIFLDQGQKEEWVLECLDKMRNFFLDEEILVKRHPRIKEKIDYSKYTVADDGLPIEIICSFFDFSNCIFVSHSSTGCVTPYLLCDSSSFSFMLYRVGGEEQRIFNEIDRYLDAICEKSKKKWLYIPQSVAEFEHEISEICNEVTGTRKNCKNEKI